MVQGLRLMFQDFLVFKIFNLLIKIRNIHDWKFKFASWNKNKQSVLILSEIIEQRILLIRGQKVMQYSPKTLRS